MSTLVKRIVAVAIGTLVADLAAVLFEKVRRERAEARRVARADGAVVGEMQGERAVGAKPDPGVEEPLDIRRAGHPHPVAGSCDRVHRAQDGSVQPLDLSAGADDLVSVDDEAADPGNVGMRRSFAALTDAELDELYSLHWSPPGDVGGAVQHSSQDVSSTSGLPLPTHQSSPLRSEPGAAYTGDALAEIVAETTDTISSGVGEASAGSAFGAAAEAAPSNFYGLRRPPWASPGGLVPPLFYEPTARRARELEQHEALVAALRRLRSR